MEQSHLNGKQPHFVSTNSASNEKISNIGSTAIHSVSLNITTRTGPGSPGSRFNQLWIPSEKSAKVIYENICGGCQYGIFEAEGRYCNFCQYILNGNIQNPKETPENIYENICKCGKVCSSDTGECETCTVQRNSQLNSTVFQDLIGTLKRVRSRNKKSLNCDATRHRKLEIIHNVRTIEDSTGIKLLPIDKSSSIDLAEHYNIKGRRIYGKLRKSENSSSSIDRDASRCATLQLHSVELNTEPISSLARSPSTSVSMVDKWLTSLRRETHDYSPQLVDTIFNIKSIPSQNFNCCGFSWSPKFVNYVDVTSNLIGEHCIIHGFEQADNNAENDSLAIRVNLKLNDFKKHLMEKRLRSKRCAIYFKVDETDADEQANSVNSGNGLAVGVTDQSRRHAFHERNSKFVNDIPIAFDTFMDCESESKSSASKVAAIKSVVHAPSLSPPETNDCGELVETEYQQQIAALPLAGNHPVNVGSVVASIVMTMDAVSPASYRRQYKCEIIRSFFNQTGAFIRPAKLRNLLTTISISKSLNKCVIFFEPHLRTFLLAISASAYHSKLDQPRLIGMYAVAAIMLTSADNGEDNKIQNSDVTTQNHDAFNDDIYQPIWKFRTIGNPRESYSSMEPGDEIIDSLCEPSTTSGPNDDGEYIYENETDWETDDEFVFTIDRNSIHSQSQSQGSPSQPKKYLSVSRKNSPRLGDRIRALKTSIVKPYSSSQSLASISSTQSANSAISSSTDYSTVSRNSKSSYNVKRKYQRICVLFSLEDPRLRAIVYNCDDIREQTLTSHLPRNYNSKNRDNSYSQLKRKYNDPTDPSNKDVSKEAKGDDSTPNNYFIPLSVQAWKFSLLHVNYMEDEEDMYICRNKMISTYHAEDCPPTTLKKCASEGNLLQIPQDKKKTFGERFINKFQAVGFFPISPRQMKEKKKLDNFKRRGSIGPYYPNISTKVSLFGAELEKMQLSGTTNVPKFVIDCINIIERDEFISTDGLYRASGNKVDIDHLKKNLTEKYDAKILENQDIHTITGLLKLFFRELKTALISDGVYNKLPDNLTDKENLSSIKNVLYLMSCVSRDTLRYLIKHLTKVAGESHTNRMPASNLAIIWGPCILYSSFTNPMSIARINTLTKILIEQYDIIFNEDERLV